MEKLDNDNLQELTSSVIPPAVTIYIPMHNTSSPQHITENQLRFKNLLHAAAREIRAYEGEASLFANQLESVIDAFHNDLRFWESQNRGLLICAQPEDIRLFELPIDTEEYLAIDQHFHLAPIIGLLQDAHDFYVLSLARQNPKLYRGTLYGLEVVAAELPESIKAALNIDETDQKGESQATAGAPAGGGGSFNGRGADRSPEVTDRVRFFRMIDKAVCQYTDQNLPLILAGTETDVAEYRSISEHPQLLKTAISGNRSADDNRTLFDAANHILRDEIIVPEHQAAIEEYTRLSGANPERVAFDAKGIDQAAKQGRVDKLLTRLSRYTADTVRDQLEAVPRLTFPSGKDRKWLNDVVLAVWHSSGTVYNLAPDEMPEGKLMAARLRY